MKKSIPVLVILVSLFGLSGCQAPAIQHSEVAGQTRFEQQQKGYPDRLNSSQEADAAARARQRDMREKP